MNSTLDKNITMDPKLKEKLDLENLINNPNLKFSIIYTFDIPSNVSVNECGLKPPRVKSWQCTEQDECFEYDYLEGEWKNGKHRKYCSILNRKQFEEFVLYCDLCFEDVETMGSLGAPGFGMGWSPAFSFNSFDDYCNSSFKGAYVTPFIDDENFKHTDEVWKKFKAYLKENF